MLSRLSGSDTTPPSSRIVPFDERASELQCVERIPARRRVHAHERRPRQVQGQPLREQPVDRAERERFEREPVVTPRRRGRGRAAPAPASSAQGREDADRLAVQSPEHEAEDLRRARVHPLHVVERDEQRPLLGEHAHGRDERDARDTRIRGRPVGLAQEQCDLERAPLNRHERRQRLVQRRREQIADRRERHLGLCGRRARGEDAEPAGLCRVHALVQERGLADSGVAFDQGAPAHRRHSFDEPGERLQLRPPADDRFCQSQRPPVHCRT